MPKKSLPHPKLVHYLCAALMLVLLILQFTPYWHYGEASETAVSIGSYIWFPTNHTDLTAHFQQVTGNPAFLVNNILIPCILMLLLSAGGIVLCILKPSSLLSSLTALACGLSGVIGFLSKPVLRMGSTWGIMLALCILLVCGGAYGLVMRCKTKCDHT